MTEFCGHRNVGPVQGSSTALISLGANLVGPAGQTPLDTCRQAVLEIDLLPGVRLRGLSRWFLSAPVPPSSQPDYINAVAAVLVDASYATDPNTLLCRLQTIESACGRVRSVPNAARTLDLDIIAIGNQVRLSPDPILPHPRAHERAFVLLPLLDVASDWIHPVLRQAARALLANLPAQPIWPLEKHQPA